MPEENGRPVANRVEGGKRPRSSMAPTIAYDRYGRVAIVAGSPGGSAIINYVTKTLIGIIDWGLDPQAAIALPNFGSRNGPTELESGHRRREARAETAGARRRRARDRVDQRRAGDRAHEAMAGSVAPTRGAKAW